jgi:ATP-dependent DNA helicase DinG
VATEHFGVSVSSARLARLCHDAWPLLERELGAGAADHAHRIAALGELFYDALARVAHAADGRAALSSDVWAGEVEGSWFALDTALEGLGGRIHAITMDRQAVHSSPGLAGPSPRALEGLSALARRASTLRDDLASIARGTPGSVVWFESGGRARKVSSSPVELASIFRTRLFDVVPAIVLTSATLSGGGRASSPSESEHAPLPATDFVDEDVDPERSDLPRLEPPNPFRFQRQRLGLDGDVYRIDELQVPSPFAFEEQALLYLPSDLPSPDAVNFAGAAAQRSAELIASCDGGTFVLTTSLRAMHAIHRGLDGQLGSRLLLVQGQAPKAALIERFRAAGDAVLVATLSFWQGVDIPGAALRLVVLEKVPFPVPSDPIVQARSQALTALGESPFIRLHLPLAQLTLKQGFGRLIRSRSDHGVVALLDNRVHRRGYGRRLLDGLPPARRVTELADVLAFWARHREETP